MADLSYHNKTIPKLPTTSHDDAIQLAPYRPCVRAGLSLSLSRRQGCVRPLGIGLVHEDDCRLWSLWFDGF